MENAGKVHNYLLIIYIFILCSCNEGYTGPACSLASVLTELREDFSEYPLNNTLWSSIQGNNGNLNSRCGRLTGKIKFML